MKTYVNFTRGQKVAYYLASCFGLAPFILKNNILHPPGFLRKAYPWVLGALSSVWTFFKFVHHKPEATESNSAKEIVLMIRAILLLGLLLSIQLTMAFKSGKMIEIFNRIFAVQNELENLGVRDNRKKNRNMVYAKLIATNFTILSMKAIVSFADEQGYQTTGSKDFMWIGNILLTICYHNAIMIFLEIVICISELFESLNNKLEGIIRPKYHLPRLRNPPGIEVPREIIADSENVCMTSKDVEFERIGELHEELCDLTKSTTRVITAPVIFAILLHLSKLLPNSYSMYTVEITMPIPPILQKVAAETTIAVLELFLIAKACTFVSSMGNATKLILHKLWNKYYPDELEDEFLVFSMQLLHKPVSVSAFGFFNLDYSFLTKILYLTLAYLIMMIQLDTLKSETRT